MVWYFIGVYIINRTLHGRLEIRNFSSRVEKKKNIFTSETNVKRKSERVKCFFSTREEKFPISARSRKILYFFQCQIQYFLYLFPFLSRVSQSHNLQDPDFEARNFYGNFSSTIDSAVQYDCRYTELEAVFLIRLICRFMVNGNCLADCQIVGRYTTFICHT